MPGSVGRACHTQTQDCECEPCVGHEAYFKKKKEKKRGVRGSDLCPCVVKECRVPRVEAEGPSLG